MKAQHHANYIKSKGITDKIKLQKLLYISFGFYATFEKGNYLFQDTIEAWKYGPVVPSVYNNPSYPNKTPLKDDKAKKHIDRVLRFYGDKNPFSLVDLTHKKGTPWHNNYEEGKHNEIPKQEIIEYYQTILGSSILILKGDSRRILEDFAKR